MFYQRTALPRHQIAAEVAELGLRVVPLQGCHQVGGV